jgi:phosphoglycolate phosphatase-like HAD superfamily hydrolase
MALETSTQASVNRALNADAFFFDIDGTLVVTRDLVHWNALHQAMLETYGVDTNIEGLSYHGKTDIAILRAALERCGVNAPAFYERLEEALKVLCREVTAHAGEIEAKVCPGIAEVLAQFRDDGRMLAVASGNLEIVGWHKITAAGLREFFVSGSFGDCCELRNEIFSQAVASAKRTLGRSASVCFVGDTPDDIMAARHAEAAVIAVSTGTFSSAELAVFEPDICCKSCLDLCGMRTKIASRHSPCAS